MFGWLSSASKVLPKWLFDPGVAKESRVERRHSAYHGVGAAAQAPTAKSAQAPTKPRSALNFSPPKAPLGQQPRASLAQFATMSQSRPAVALPDGDTEPRWYRSHTGHKHCKKSGRRMVYCLCCGGIGLCVHGKQKYKCQECRGASLCVHLNQKSRCRKCKMANVPGCGSGICPHNREKWRCNDCKS